MLPTWLSICLFLAALGAAFFFVRWCRRRAVEQHAIAPGKSGKASAPRSRKKPAARKAKGRGR